MGAALAAWVVLNLAFGIWADEPEDGEPSTSG
jgi:hypothetical protein